MVIFVFIFDIYSSWGPAAKLEEFILYRATYRSAWIMVYNYYISHRQFDYKVRSLSYWIWWLTQSEYCWTVIIAVKSKPSSLFGDKLLQINWESSIRQSFMSSIEYPDIMCTVWLFQISRFNSTRSSLTWQLLKNPFWLY